MSTVEAVVDTAEQSEAIAEEAGLSYVADSMPGIRRRRRGRGFSYADADGHAIDDRTIRRIKSLAIPPAWTDVWICPSARGHLQATGHDAKGRKQYRYHDRWREVRDADKFSRLADFGARLAELRERVEDDLAGGATPTPDRVVALVVKLLDETLIRVGNEEYAVDNDSFGLTTLRPCHVDVARSGFTLCFVGKSGVEHDVTIDDPKLARVVKRCHELGGHELFAYRNGDGQTRTVSSSDVNDWLHEVAGPDTTAKTFRTWGATALVTRSLAALGPPETDKESNELIVAAIDEAAERLRNTRAVCRQSYVHPNVLDAYRDGSLAQQWRDTRAGGRMSRAERTAQRVLDSEAPG